MSVTVCVEFSGGAELLFDNAKSIELSLAECDDGGVWNVAKLIAYLKENLLKERPELFVKDGTVRPGILVLINQTDWELLGETEYEINDGDTVTFISTLHGG